MRATQGIRWRRAGRQGIALLLLGAAAALGAEVPSTPLEPLPGAPPRGPELVTALAAALAAQPADYAARTEHRSPDGGPRFVNRLIREASPYLLQHAHNPVDWHPWGPEAFALARRLDRPVLLSVGYSTCHWCHVMERESFEDLEIAQFINENFIAIKVDREERPDVDAVYMGAVQLLTGRGGWPMTVWLTPDAEAFFGGTYFPARDGDRGASVGFLTLLARVRSAYENSRPDVYRAGARLTTAVRQLLAAEPAAATRLPGLESVDRAAQFFQERFDPDHGGTRGAPKFPSHTPLRLLLRHYYRTADERSLTMALRTLEGMAAGGIHDQVGGGFHRYSTDARWLVPHFEKMLYDNALLALAYTEAYQLTKHRDLETVARRILDYVGREMTSPQGAFYSATDADSPTPNGDTEEGLFFTWTPAEIANVVGALRGRIVSELFGVAVGGNFEGRSILYRAADPTTVAATLGIQPAAVEAALAESLPLLYAARGERPPPLLDDKILTAWNGLMISAFAVAGRTFDDTSYRRRGEAAADFIWRNMRVEDRLVRSYRGGATGSPAVLEDSAFLIAAFLDLYETTSDPRWLDRARTLQSTLDAHYLTPTGAYYRTAADSEALLAREIPTRDGALPSGNSYAALNLLRLAEFTSDDSYRARADRLLASLGDALAASPAALTEALLAVEFRHARPQEVVLVMPSRAEARPFVDLLRERFAPHQVVIMSEAAALLEHSRLVPLLAGKRLLDGVTTAYVCEGGVCQLPTTDLETFRGQLAKGHEPAARSHPVSASSPEPQ